MSRTHGASGGAAPVGSRLERVLLLGLSAALAVTAGLSWDAARHGAFVRADGAPPWIAAGLGLVAAGSMLLGRRVATLPRAALLAITLLLAWLTPLAHRHHIAELRAAAEGPARAALLGRRAPPLEWARGFHAPPGSGASFDHPGGRLTLVDFWATWCGPCRVHMPRLEGLYHRFGPDRVQVIGVTMLYGDRSEAGDRSELQRIEAFLDDLGITYPVVVAATEANHRRYHAQSLPTAALIDRDGQVIDYGIGIVGTQAVFEHAQALLED